MYWDMCCVVHSQQRTVPCRQPEAAVLAPMHACFPCPAGKCEKEIEKYCKDTDEGEGKLADCISDAITESENADPNAGACLPMRMGNVSSIAPMHLTTSRRVVAGRS